MSPIMKKISMAFGVCVALVLVWAYFRMPSPDIPGLERPDLVLMDVAADDAATKAVRPAARGADGEQKTNAQRANRANRRRNANIKGPQATEENEGDGTAISERPQRRSPAARRSRPKFDREEWRKRRLKALENRQAGEQAGGQQGSDLEPLPGGEGAGDGQPLEEIPGDEQIFEDELPPDGGGTGDEGAYEEIM